MSRSTRVFRLFCRTALAAGCLSVAVAWPSSSQGASADAARQAARDAAALARARKLVALLGITTQDGAQPIGAAVSSAEARGGPPFTPPGPPSTPPGHSFPHPGPPPWAAAPPVSPSSP